MSHRYGKLGRIERIARRLLIEADAWPVTVRDVLTAAFPGQPRVNSHYVSLYRACRRGKGMVRRRRGLIGPTRELEMLIRGE
jgi:hypothetical protein